MNQPDNTANQPESIKNETIACTGEHPFYVVERRAFIPAKQLSIGETFSLINGRTVRVTNLATQDANPGETFTTYNIEVEDHHTYFVSRSGAWVHNVGDPCQKSSKEFQRLRKTMPDDEALTLARKHLHDQLDELEKAGKGISDAERHLHDMQLDKLIKKAQNEAGETVKDVSKATAIGGSFGHGHDRRCDRNYKESGKASRSRRGRGASRNERHHGNRSAA